MGRTLNGNHFNFSCFGTIPPKLAQRMEVAAFYGVACGMVHLVAQLSFDILFKDYRSLSTSHRLEGYNRFVSLIHSSLMFGLDVRYWWNNHIFAHVKDKIYSSMEKSMIDIMIGYLVYDIIFELFKGLGNSGTTSGATKISKRGKYKGIVEHILIILHHFAGIISHISTRVSNNSMCFHYSMLVYLAEASTPTLNITWFLYVMKWDKNIFFSIVAHTTLVSFFIVRVLLSPYLVLHMLYYREDWGDGTFLLFYGNLIIMTIFALLNFVWFYKLINMSRKVDTEKHA